MDCAPKVDDVTGGDHALIVQAEAASQIEATRQERKSPTDSARPGRSADCNGRKGGEHGVGRGQRGGLGQAKFAVQTILARAPSAFDVALDRRRVGADLFDAAFFMSASELSGSLFSGELFGESPVGIVALEDGTAVAMEAEREAVRGDRGGQRAEIAGGVFSASSWK
jgi:hypothetical protein